MSSRKQGTTPARRRVPDWEPTSPALDRQTYALKEGWLEILAGDNPDLRNGDGKPMATVISAAAGLDRTRLTRVMSGQYAITTEIMGSLINFLMVYRGYTEEGARAALFIKRAAPADRPIAAEAVVA